jgi:hypothetical protein
MYVHRTICAKIKGALRLTYLSHLLLQTLGNTDIVKKLGEQWRSLPANEKKVKNRHFASIHLFAVLEKFFAHLYPQE